MHGPIPPLPNTPSWRVAEFKESTGTLLFISPCIIITVHNLGLRSSRRVRHQVPQPYKTTGKTILLHMHTHIIVQNG